MVDAQIMSILIRQAIQRLVEDQRTREASDEELLRQFSDRVDEGSFHALMRRHGPMVLGVCRAVLRHEADVEDAFQATFLILARKPASVRKPAALGSWLHGVAYRTAIKAQARFASRRQHESRAGKREAAVEDRSWLDVERVLHEELNHLAEGYRAPLVLCYLQGKNQDEAARLLNLPKGTLKGRLERGRALLRTQLLRRGLGPAALLLASAWPTTPAAAMPASLVISTVKAASLTAAGEAARPMISANVAALTEGVIRAMYFTKMKTGAIAACLIGILTLGAGMLVPDLAAVTSPPAQDVQKPATPGNKPPALNKVVERGAELRQPDGPSARQIIERMAKAYTDCKAYQDSGVVKTLFIEDGGNRTVEKPFTTAFVRAGRLRFEFTDTIGKRPMRYIVWSDGKEVQTWWDVAPGIKKPESLRLALGGAAGVSGNASLNIPQLLLPDQFNWRRLAPTDAKRDEDGKLDRVECFRVEGKYGGNPITLWIDKKLYLVRRIDEKAKFDTFRTEQTTTFAPIMNEKMIDKMLEFDPPVPQ